MDTKKLRQKVLDLAIHGKLVKQNPNDEPASILLDRIRAEKARLVKEGKIKKSDLIEKPISEDEIPFEVPEGWEWERWGNISLSIQYGYNAPAEPTGDIKMVRITDIQNNKVLWDSVPFCKISKEDIETYLLKPNDILFARTGGTVGKSFLVNEVPEPSIYAGYLIRTRYSNSLNPKYMKYFMESELYWSQLRDGTTSTAQPNCNGKTLSKMILPLPPLAEQHRIVKAVDELFEQIDIIERSEKELEEAANKTRDKLLNLAIQGHLVPQDPNEEPASVLLERIRAEKARLVKEGKLKKKDLEEKPIFPDEIPFDIPEGWVWCRFGTITINRDSERIPLSVEERSKLEKKYDYYGASGVIDKVDKYLFNKPLLLIGEDGANLINRSTPIAFIARGEYWVNNHAHVLDYIDDVLMQYMCWYINAISLVKYITGTAQPKMNQEKMNSILVPLPPISEQRRIVSKLEELLHEIDKLKG